MLVYMRTKAPRTKVGTRMRVCPASSLKPVCLYTTSNGGSLEEVLAQPIFTQHKTVWRRRKKKNDDDTTTTKPETGLPDEAFPVYKQRHGPWHVRVRALCVRPELVVSRAHLRPANSDEYLEPVEYQNSDTFCTRRLVVRRAH